MTAWTHPRLQHWDDERRDGNSLIVTLQPGWRFTSDPIVATHVEGFDRVKDAQAAVRRAVPCSCADCRPELTEAGRAAARSAAKQTTGPCEPLRKPGARVARGLGAIRNEMGCVADVKAGEGADGRREALAIRAALAYIDAAIAKATGGAA